MSIKLVCFLGTLPLLILWPARSQAAEPAAATIKSEKNHLDFVVGDDLVGRYQFGKDAAKPYFWPLHGPGGVIITRGWPMEKAPEGGSMDHPHQKSAWFCHGDVIPEGLPLKVGPIVHLAEDLSCPLLGLFGADDSYPGPDEVAELDKALTEAGKAHEFHSYEGAGHAFFAVNRPSYRPEAAMDGWQKIWDFYGRYLAG